MKLQSRARVALVAVAALAIVGGTAAIKAKAKARGFTIYSTAVVGQPATNTLSSATIVLSGGAFATVTTVYSDPGVRTRTIFQE